MSLAAPIICEHHGFYVVRDDLLSGGTKRRILQPLVEASPYQEFVYASPAYGYAQLALAYACQAVGKQATVFTAKRKQPHTLSLQAKQAGAKVVMVPYGYLSHVQSKAKAYAETVGACYLPFGVDSPESLQLIADVARSIGEQPKEVWAVSGSGTLTRGLQLAWSKADFHTVLVGKQGVDTGKATVYSAPEKFEQAAKQPPPWPSCANYDAKLWRFLREYGKPGAWVWNVGR